MKALLAILLVFLLTAPVPYIALANSPLTEEATLNQTKEFFGTPISATWGYHDFADLGSESYLPFQAFFNNSMGRVAKICDMSNRDTVFIVEKENHGLASILFSLVAAGSQQILLLRYKCMDLNLDSGRHSASFAVIKSLFVGVSNNSQE